MDRKLQRHRADSLRQHGFLVHLDLTKAFDKVNHASLTYHMKLMKRHNTVTTAAVTGELSI